MSDRYATVTVRLVRINPNSFIVVNPEDPDGEEHVIVRYCVHGADEKLLAGGVRGEEYEVRVFEWIAKKEDLL